MTRGAVLILLVGFVLGCNGSDAGVLRVVLTTPNSGGDRAILLTVSGPAVPSSAAPAAGLRLFSEPLAATNKFALTGTLVTGTILTLGIPNISQANLYTATIQQIAMPTYQLRALTGYSLQVSK